VEPHPGDDGYEGVVTMKSGQKLYQRTIRKLVTYT